MYAGIHCKNWHWNIKTSWHDCYYIWVVGLYIIHKEYKYGLHVLMDYKWLLMSILNFILNVILSKS